MENNYISRYTSKDAEKYGQNIFEGLRKLNEKKNSQINPIFEEEIQKLVNKIYENRKNLTIKDLHILEFFSNKLYTE